MFNLVEIGADNQHESPCKHGNIVDGHACYCHAEAEETPRKCQIWSNYGEHDLSKWHDGGDFENEEWDGGCKWFVPNSTLT